MTEEEAVNRVKLSIDRQLSGDIEQVFLSRKLTIRLGVLDDSGSENDVYVETVEGCFGIRPDGSTYEVFIEKRKTN